MSNTFTVARRPEIRRLLLSVTASATGRWVYNVGLAAFVFDTTHSAVWLAALAVGRYLPSMLISPVAAVAAGRFPQRSAMVTCDVIAAIAITAITVAAELSAPVVVVVILAAATSSVTRARVPVTAAFLAEIVDEQDLAAANAALRSTESAALVMGPLLGALLVAAGHPPLALGFTAAEFAISAVTTATLPTGEARPELPPETGMLHELAVGIRTIAGRPASRYFALLGAASSLLFGVDTVMLVVLAHERLHSGSAGYGLLLAGLGVGGLVGALAVDRLCRTSHLGVIAAVALSCYAAPTALFVVVHSQAVALPIEAVRGGGSLLAEAVALTALQRSTRGEGVQRVLAVFYGSLLAALVIGAAVTPMVLHYLGLDWALVLAGGAVSGVVVLMLPRLLSLDREGAAWAAELTRRVAVLSGLQIFSGALRSTLERLAAGLTESTVPAGHVVVAEGEPADAFYVIVEGSVEVFSDAESGERSWLRRLDAPAYVGEIGLIHQVPRTATVVTTTPARLFRAEGTDFLSALSDAPIAPALADGVLAMLTRHRSSVGGGESTEADEASEIRRTGHDGAPLSRTLP